MSHCPKLYLAPMEGVASSHFRKAIATIGGFDEATAEFLSVPTNAHVKSLAKTYSPYDTAPIPQAAQLMGSCPEKLAAMGELLSGLYGCRIDLNCGCPSNTVTGHGAGSSLLKNPAHLFTIVQTMKRVTKTCLSVKIRSGFEDTSLFMEIVSAVEAGGADFITIHPRTKLQGYSGNAEWEYIRRAKEHLTIPVVGNGDIRSADDVKKMLKITGCDAVMVGRRTLENPWIFHEIRKAFDQDYLPFSYEKLYGFIQIFVTNLSQRKAVRSHINQLKQLFRYLFSYSEELRALQKPMLQFSYLHVEQFLKRNLPLLKTHYQPKDL